MGTLAKELAERLPGGVVTPGDADFAIFEQWYALGSHPEVVVRPESPQDVAAAIGFARENGMAVSVRSGGHGGPMFTLNTSHVLVDLSRMAEVEVLGGERNLVRIGGGAVWGDIARTLQPHGLALSSGDTASVGVGGLTLGGGVGWMVRQYGLALDSLVEVELVTASGDIITASDTEHPDLFWALRGGGGNFGVVTRFTFEAHPLHGIIGGMIMFDEQNLVGALRAWRDFMRGAPEKLNSTFMAMPELVPEMPSGVMVQFCYADTDRAAAEEALAPLLAFDGVVGHELQPMDYADILEDPEEPEDVVSLIAHNAYAPDFSDELVDAVAAAYRGMGPSMLMIRSLGAALGRVAEDATAFAFRDSEVLIISAAFPSPEDPGATDVIETLWGGIVPFARGTYPNFHFGPSPGMLALAYPAETLARLVQVKVEYDPENLFRCNHNLVASG